MPTPITKYKCDFCLAGGYETIEEAEKHEAQCIMNVAVHGCKTCSCFLKPVGWTDRSGRFTGKSERCSKNIPLHAGFKKQCPEWDDEIK